MKLPTYSSLAAFLAHYAALRIERYSNDRVKHDLNSVDVATLTEMEGILGEVNDSNRDALLSVAPANAIYSGGEGRHRARAELKLRRLLAARGILAG